MDTVYYEMIVNITGLAQTLMIISFAFQDGEDFEAVAGWIELSIYINMIFAIEMLVYFILIGSVRKAYINRFKLWPESVC